LNVEHQSLDDIQVAQGFFLLFLFFILLFRENLGLEGSQPRTLSVSYTFLSLLRFGLFEALNSEGRKHGPFFVLFFIRFLFLFLDDLRLNSVKLFLLMIIGNERIFVFIRQLVLSNLLSAFNLEKCVLSFTRQHQHLPITCSLTYPKVPICGLEAPERERFVIFVQQLHSLLKLERQPLF